MTPAARVQAAVEILDRVLSGAPAEQALTAWARSIRFAGSGDRAAVRDHVFDALRCLRSYGALAGSSRATGRALMIGAARARGQDTGSLFTGAPHAPAPLSPDEAAALAVAPGLSDLPPCIAADCPDWLAPELSRSLGAGYLAEMAAQRARAPIFLRVNTARTDPVAAIARLKADGIGADPSPLADTALYVSENASRIKQSRAYLDGLVELQDASSQAAVGLLDLAQGMSVLDYCAGGGGKALAMAARARLSITAHDGFAARLKDLPVRAARAGARITLARPGTLGGKVFDLVLVDAPCSGSGTWRRSPDAKWRLDAADLARLTALQDQILAEASLHVRSGGRLAYMTCSLLACENEDRLLPLAEKGFRLDVTRRYLPSGGSDGFFAAVLTRV